MGQRIFEDFTLVDFWGVTVPGGMFAFLLNEFCPLGYIYQNLIGQYVKEPSEVGLAVFILLVSYLLGNIIHEIGDWVEKFCAWCSALGLKKINHPYISLYMRKRALLWLDFDTKNYIQKSFSINNNSGYKDYKIMISKISTELYTESKLGKTKLFESFRVMSRNSAVVLFIWLQVSVFGDIDVFRMNIPFVSSHRMLGLMLGAIFILRSMHYAFLKYKYYYESYYQIHIDNQKKKPSNPVNTANNRK